MDPGDQEALGKALAGDARLRARLESLDESDRELRLRYPVESMGFFEESKPRSARSSTEERKNKKIPMVNARVSLLVAASLLCILLPVLYFVQNGIRNDALSTDRAKGAVAADYELYLYLKGGGELPLPDQAMLSEGNTVQLAYATPVGERYGVIFSIDGRSEVTLHYPYRKGQSSLLVSGRRTFLSEAYTLDDAPDYEVFVMVVSIEPLDVEAVLLEAEKIAGTPGTQAAGLQAVDLRHIEEKSRAAFEEFEVETLAVLKKSTDEEV